MTKKNKTKPEKRILLVGYINDNHEHWFSHFEESIFKKYNNVDILIQSNYDGNIKKDVKDIINLDIVSDVNAFFQQQSTKKPGIYDQVVIIDFSKIDEKQIRYDTILLQKNYLSSNYIINSVKETKKNSNGILILSPRIFDYILETNLISKDDPIKTITTILSRLDIPFLESALTKENIENPKKDIFDVFKKRIFFWVIWYFRLPIEELKTKPHKRYDFIKVSSINRFLFQIIILFSFIALPILSLSVGNSGDEEEWQYPQSQKIIKFYTSLGKDKSYKNVKANFHTYGNSFDTISSVIINTLGIKNIYEARHIMNSLVGCFIILIIGLLVKRITDWRGGLIAVILMLLSPRFLGHSLNNPKDIPFAFGYIFSMYYFIKFFIEFPKIKVKTLVLASLGIGISLSVRAGGLVLIPYLVVFAGAYLFFKVFVQKQKLKYAKIYGPRLLLAITSICLLGYLFGIPLWPFAIENPLQNPIKALSVLTKFSVGIRQLFDGKLLWSDSVPWNYLPKYYFITTPIVVLAGLFLFFTFINKWNNKLKVFLTFVLLFSFIFPVAYIIYKKSNVYGAIRHTVFIYPMIVATAAAGINNFLYKIKTNIAKLVAIFLLTTISLHPLIHIIKNKPLLYIYFNQLAGGVKGAYGKYELDYYFHSLKKASNWFIENELPKVKKDSLIIATNFNVSYYFREYEDRIKTTYLRYYNRGNSDWDYAIIANTYINPEQLKNKSWPPENTIHTVNVDDVPVCAILKREQKFDLSGYQKLRQKDYSGAIVDLKKALQQNKTNEVAYNNLATAYIYTRRFDLARQTINQLLEIYPKYDKALNLLGLTYFNERNYEEAYKIFTSITEMNPKFFSAYHNLGLVFMRMNKGEEAIKYFQQAIRIKRNYKPSYLAIAQILKQMGKDAEAQKYTDAANKLK